jgi:hypothetical protein
LEGERGLADVDLVGILGVGGGAEDRVDNLVQVTSSDLTVGESF